MEERRNKLLTKLRPKEQNYFLECYQCQERQFVQAYTKKFANFRVESSQIAESSYIAIKEVTNRHTLISIVFDKICTYIKILQRKLEAEANVQRSHLLQIMDRNILAVVGSLVIYETIFLISIELNKAKH